MHCRGDEVTRLVRMLPPSLLMPGSIRYVLSTTQHTRDTWKSASCDNSPRLRPAPFQCHGPDRRHRAADRLPRIAPGRAALARTTPAL